MVYTEQTQRKSDAPVKDGTSSIKNKGNIQCKRIKIVKSSKISNV